MRLTQCSCLLLVLHLTQGQRGGIFSFFGNLFRPRRPNNQGGVPVISPQGFRVRPLITLDERPRNVAAASNNRPQFAQQVAADGGVFADVAQPDQGRIVALNSQFFLKNGGNFVISIKANCIDSTAEPEAVFAGEVKKMQAEKMKPQEQVTLEPYERDHAVVVGVYRPPPKKT